MSANLDMHTLGKITVATPGTPVNAVAQAATNSTDSGVDPNHTTGLARRVYSITIQAWPGNTDDIWVGRAQALNRTTGANVVAIVPPGGSATITLDRGAAQMGPGLLDLSKIWLDADVGAEGALVSYVRA